MSIEYVFWLFFPLAYMGWPALQYLACVKLLYDRAAEIKSFHPSSRLIQHLDFSRFINEHTIPWLGRGFSK